MDLLDKHYRKYYFACWYYVIYYNEKDGLDHVKREKKEIGNIIRFGGWELVH